MANYLSSTPNTAPKKILWGTGCAGITLALLCLALLLTLGGAWWLTLGARAPLEVAVTAPPQVKLNDNVEVEIQIRNQANQLFIVDMVTVDSSLELNWGRGLSLVSVLPPHTDLATRNDKQFIYFPITVQSKQSNTIKLKFKATQRGTFRGLIFIDGKLEETREALHTAPKQIEVKVE